jgi:hypothetical protein
MGDQPFARTVRAQGSATQQRRTSIHAETQTLDRAINDYNNSSSKERCILVNTNCHGPFQNHNYAIL